MGPPRFLLAMPVADISAAVDMSVTRIPQEGSARATFPSERGLASTTGATSRVNCRVVETGFR